MTENTESNVIAPARLFPHREISLKFIKSSSGFAVRTPRGQKDPGHIQWDPRTNTLEKSEQSIVALERTDDNIAIHFFGTLVDVDVDSDNPNLMAALESFLPYTAHVYGRPSRPRTHRIYELTGCYNNEFDPNAFRFLNILAKHDDIKLEVRGGKLQSGRYSLMPGSLHPSGEPYEWDNLRVADSTPVYTSVDALMGAIRKACAAAILMPYFTEGSRNKLCMALSGFLFRVVQHVEETNDPAFYFDKDDALKFITTLLDLVDDDESDRNSRIKTFEKTWQKAENGEKTIGLTSIVEDTGEESIVQLLYALLLDSKELQELDDFIDRYWVRNNTSDIIDIEKMGRRDVVSIMAQAAFRQSNLHRKIAINGERKSLVDMLLHSKRANRFDGFAFAPDEQRTFYRRTELYVNQWNGFHIPPWHEPVTAQEVEPFITYVKEILADNQKEYYDWIMCWIADIFKHPSDKCGTALVLVGLPGSGKSFLGSKIIRGIIGHDHSMQVNHISQITSQFNADSSGKLFIQCDEAINSRRHEDSNKLKSLITDPTKRVEPKGVDAFEVENHARFQFTSNNIADAVSITDGRADRRYAVFETNNKYAEDSKLPKAEKDAFWKKMYDWVDDEENLAKLHRYFVDSVYDRNVIRRPIDTKARRRIQQHSLRGLDDWLIQLAASDHPLAVFPDRDPRSKMSCYMVRGKYRNDHEKWPEVINYSALKDAYELYRSRKGMKATTADYNEAQLMTEFISKGILDKRHKITKADIITGYNQMGDPIVKRTNMRSFPTLEKIQEYVLRFGFNPLEDSAAEMSEEVITFDNSSSEGPSY